MLGSILESLKAAGSGVLRGAGRSGANAGRTIGRSAAGNFAAGATRAFSGLGRALGGTTNFSTRGVMSGTMSALVGRGEGGLRFNSILGSGLPKFAALQAASSAMSYVADTPWGQEQAPAVRAALNIGSFFSSVQGYRHLAKGIVGSSLYGSGRAQGDAAKYFKPSMTSSGAMGPGLYDQSMRALGGFTTRDSLLNRATRLAGGLAGRAAIFTAQAPFRMAAGVGGMGWAVGRAAFRDIPRAGVGFVQAARAKSLMGARPMGSGFKGWARSNKAFDLGDALSVRLPSGRVSNALKKTGITNAAGDMPLSFGAFGMGAMVGAIGVKHQFDQYNRKQNFYGAKEAGIDPRNWPRGMKQGRTRGADNFGPALTLGLHYRHPRVL